MAEEQQVMKESQQVTTKEPQQVTTKNLKKVEAGKTLAAHNHRKREELKVKREEQVQKSGVNQYYGIGAVLAVGVIGGFGYYIYRTKERGKQSLGTCWLCTTQWSMEGPTSREQSSHPQQNNPSKPRPQSNKFEMD